MKTYMFGYAVKGRWSVQADSEEEAKQLAEAYLYDNNDDRAGEQWEITNMSGRKCIRDYQCYINEEPWTCPDCGGHTLKSVTIEHQATGKEYIDEVVVAQAVEVEDGCFSVTTYDEYPDDEEVPIAEDEDGSYWEVSELRCAWCNKEVDLEVESNEDLLDEEDEEGA